MQDKRITKLNNSSHLSLIKISKSKTCSVLITAYSIFISFLLNQIYIPCPVLSNSAVSCSQTWIIVYVVVIQRPLKTGRFVWSPMAGGRRLYYTPILLEQSWCVRCITVSPLIRMSRNFLWIFLAMSLSAVHKNYNSISYIFLVIFLCLILLLQFLSGALLCQFCLELLETSYAVFLAMSRSALHKNINPTSCRFWSYSSLIEFISTVLVRSITLSPLVGMSRNLTCVFFAMVLSAGPKNSNYISYCFWVISLWLILFVQNLFGA